MAHIATTMTAVGTEPPCAACDRHWRRGQRMSAVEAEDSTPLGWICDACIDEWRKLGTDSAPARKLMGS